ncbi:transposable element Tc1 transposase [Trichonephila clavipes]|nr:transposable element Tc1 transposase [Trichonephila clavipes]
MPPATVRDLEIALLEEWNSIPQSLIDNLIASMANRVVKGWFCLKSTMFQVATGATEKEDRHIRRTVVVHRTASAKEIRATIGTTVTQRTVRNQLLQGHLRARRPVACVPLTPSHCRKRCQWCQSLARLGWRSTVFSEESRFCFGASDGDVWVGRPGERL